MKAENPIDYANIVTPEEMQDVRQWLDRMLGALTARRDESSAQARVTCLSQGWGELMIGASINEGQTPLCLAGRTYPSGLGTHADSEIRVQLPARGRRLSGLCGVDDNRNTRQLVGKNLVFSIEVGGKEVWRSGPQNAAAAPASFSIPLAGSRQFTLKVRGPINLAHADWVDLKATLADGRTVTIGQPPAVSPGFSFVYDRKSSVEFLATWDLKKQRSPEKDGIVQHRITRTDARTGLALICEIKEYTRFPVVEWVLRLKNRSARKTPLLEDVRSLDVTPTLGDFPYLHYWTGDHCSPDGYEPFRVSLAHGEEYRFAPMGGRPTNRAWPYYDIECPDSRRGLIIAVGWPGQWASRFQGLGTHAVHITAGQETTHFRLLPGEEARTPLSVLMFYRGDRDRSRNLWRRWFIAHNLPRPGGQPMKPHLACAATDEGEEFTAATEQNQVGYIAKFNEQGIRPDVWWIDAGWYPCYDEETKTNRWPLTGSWVPDPNRFQRGFSPVSDCAARHGADLLIWFEPERVTPGSMLDREHPGWLLRTNAGKGLSPWMQAQTKASALLNLGHPKCRKWLTDHVCRLIKDGGIKIYRQDFNFDPLQYWRQNEAPDRQGMVENLHVQGYLRYWDDLLARNPGLWIDSCASGGRRNDLETMRRSVPLHYSDYGYGDHPVKLAFHRTLYEWIPYFKEFTLSWDLSGGARFDHQVDSYSFHCGMAPMLFASLDIRRDDYDFALAVKMIAIWRRVADLMLYGDYYPLTPYHRASDQWVARQFDRPEEGRGFIQAIRLPAAPQVTLKVYPQGIRSGSSYRFENAETGARRELSGDALATQGFVIDLPARSGAVWFYETVR